MHMHTTDRLRERERKRVTVRRKVFMKGREDILLVFRSEILD